MIRMMFAANTGRTTLLRSLAAVSLAANGLHRGFVIFRQSWVLTTTSPVLGPQHLHLSIAGDLEEDFGSFQGSMVGGGNASWWFGVLITAELILTPRNSRPTAARQISQIRGSTSPGTPQTFKCAAVSVCVFVCNVCLCLVCLCRCVVLSVLQIHSSIFYCNFNWTSKFSVLWRCVGCLYFCVSVCLRRKACSLIIVLTLNLP